MKNRWNRFFIVVLLLSMLGISVFGNVACSAAGKSDAQISAQEANLEKSEVTTIKSDKQIFTQETDIEKPEITTIKPDAQISDQETNIKKTEIITIKCAGDSVTGGVGTPDNHQAILGGSSYPSCLYTLLVNNGVNAIVENAGHGGEKTSAIVARLGGAELNTNEDLIFDSEGCAGPIDDKIIATYSDRTQYPITFTSTDTDVNPVIIDGKSYEAKIKKINGEKKVFLYKDKSDATTIIKGGSKVKLSGTSRNSVNIIFAGICDDNSVSIDDYVTMLKAGAKVNGGRYIIVGPHGSFFNRTSFVDGADKNERYANYQARMKAEFGDHFLDLYNDWYENALPISRANGIYTDLSDADINRIQEKLNSRIIPSEFTYNGSENNVHLNKAGYTVIAQLVYNKMVSLGYIR